MYSCTSYVNPQHPMQDCHIFKNLLAKSRSSYLEVFLEKRVSVNIQQIYRRTPMLKRDFNKAALQLYWNHTSAWVLSYNLINLLHIFRTPFTKNSSGRLLLKIPDEKCSKNCFTCLLIVLLVLLAEILFLLVSAHYSIRKEQS